MIKLKDTTFLLAVKIDHQDRMENLEICKDFLTKNFDTNLMILEEDETPKLKEKYPEIPYLFQKQDNDGIMRRMRLYNKAIKDVKTPFVALYDVDVVFPIEQIVSTVNAFRNDKYDMIYPYSGNFYEVPRSLKSEFIEDVEKLDKSKLNLIHSQSIGGCVFYKTQVFIDGGAGNENIIGLGFCDNEMYGRFDKLGYRIGRIEGNCYHLEHFRSISCYGNNPFGNHNGVEYYKILNMSKGSLLEYIKTFRR